jgi:lipopolysaccharide export system permease protein
MPRKGLSTLNVYILKKVVPVYFINLAVLTFLLILDKIFEIADLIIAKGIPTTLVIELLANIIPSIMTLTIPMSIVVTYLMVYGEMAADQEIIACYSSGIHPFRLFKGPFFLALLLSLFLFYFNTAVIPRANFEAKKLLFDIKIKRPAAQIIENTFIEEIEGYRIYIERVDFKKGALNNILIYDEKEDDSVRTITAESGRLVSHPKEGTLTFYLKNGSIYETEKKDRAKLFKIDFNTHEITMAYDTGPKKDWVTKGDRELTGGEIRENIQSIEKMLTPLKNQTQEYQRQLQAAGLNPADAARLEKVYENTKKNLSYQYQKINKLLVEYHKKYALAFAPLIFAFVAFPLGIITRKRQKGYSYVISIVVFVFYWVSLIGGEALGDRGAISPFMAMWFANFILAVVALYLNVLILSGHFYFSFRFVQTIKEKALALFKPNRRIR